MLFSIKLTHLDLETNEKEGETMLCRALWELLPRIQQVYEEGEGWNSHIGLHGKMADSSWSQAKIFPVAEGTKWTCTCRWLAKWFSKPQNSLYHSLITVCSYKIVAHPWVTWVSHCGIV